MNSNFLNDIYEFHYKYNTKVKILKYSIFNTILTLIFIILVGMSLSLLVLNYLTTISNTYIFIISELFTLLIVILYIFTIFKKNLKKDIKHFIKYINKNTELNIHSFYEFQTYYLLVYMMEKTEYTLRKNHFESLYQLIELHTNNLMVFDYFSQKKLLIYTGSISFIVALLTSIFEKISLLPLLIILFIIIFIIMLYSSIGPLFENQFIKEKNKYYRLNEFVKKCEIDFIYNENIKNQLSILSMHKLNNILTNFK